MSVDTDVCVAITEANKKFSKVVRLVNEEGVAIILKNNKPQYAVIKYDEYNRINTDKQERKDKIDKLINALLRDHLDILRELPK